MVLNLIFSSSGWFFILLVHCLDFATWLVWPEHLLVNTEGKKVTEYLLHVRCSQVSSFTHWGRTGTFIFLCCPTYLQKTSVIFFFNILSQVWVPWPSWSPPCSRGPCPYNLLRRNTPCLHCLCILVLCLGLPERSRLSQAGLLLPLPNFLRVRIKSSCALRKTFFKCLPALICSFVSEGSFPTDPIS